MTSHQPQRSGRHSSREYKSGEAREQAFQSLQHYWQRRQLQEQAAAAHAQQVWTIELFSIIMLTYSISGVIFYIFEGIKNHRKCL